MTDSEARDALAEALHVARNHVADPRGSEKPHRHPIGELHYAQATAILAALAARGYVLARPEPETALLQALDRMETAWNHLKPDQTDDDREAVAQALWFGQEEARAALDATPSAIEPSTLAAAYALGRHTARPEPETALRELLRRGVEIAAVMPNGYHVCRWCGATDDHEPGCQWVRHTRETTEWKAEARAALEGSAR